MTPIHSPDWPPVCNVFEAYRIRFNPSAAWFLHIGLGNNGHFKRSHSTKSSEWNLSDSHSSPNKCSPIKSINFLYFLFKPQHIGLQRSDLRATEANSWFDFFFRFYATTRYYFLVFKRFIGGWNYCKRISLMQYYYFLRMKQLTQKLFLKWSNGWQETKTHKENTSILTTIQGSEKNCKPLLNNFHFF